MTWPVRLSVWFEKVPTSHEFYLGVLSASQTKRKRKGSGTTLTCMHGRAVSGTTPEVAHHPCTRSLEKQFVSRDVTAEEEGKKMIKKGNPMLMPRHKVSVNHDPPQRKRDT